MVEMVQAHQKNKQKFNEDFNRMGIILQKDKREIRVKMERLQEATRMYIKKNNTFQKKQCRRKLMKISV